MKVADIYIYKSNKRQGPLA